jgi:N-acetylneuraminate synthase
MNKIQLTKTKVVYDFCKPYIIAEIGANHNGDILLAKKIINSAVECGADAVKFQSWDTKSLIAQEEYEKNTKYNDNPKKHFGSLYEMVEKYYLRPEQHFELKQYCDELKIEFISSPFSKKEVDLLDNVGVPFHKIASMDLNNVELIKYIASRQKPILLSTGMGTLAEIENAVKTIENQGNNQIILLHCVSIYPPQYEDINLNNISMLRKAFGYPVGFSDHTIGMSIPLASVALGVCIIEKHFTLDKELPGWDHMISANPQELEIICKESKNIHQSLGSYRRIVSKEEEKKKKFRRSIVTTRPLKSGHILTVDDLTSKRPGTGISPSEIKYVTGKTINKDIEQDTLINWDDLYTIIK